MPTDHLKEFAQTNFTSFDWAIVCVYLSVSVVIGLWVKKYATNMTAYIGAGRSVGTWLGVATMTGTELGLVTVMYSAEKGFGGGFAAFHIAVLAGIVTLLIGLTGFIVVPLRQLQVLTIPEYYEIRYNRTTRILGGIILAFGGILNMGLFLQVGAKFIVGVTGLSAEGYALPMVMTVLLALVLIYTVLGGMISVIITDYIQFVVLSFGLLVTSVMAIYRLGWSNIFATVEREMGSAGFNPLEAESQFGVEYVIWMAFLGLIGCAVWPTAVSRALAMESPAAVRRQYTWSSISFLSRFLIPYFWGICAFVFIVNEATELQPLFGIGTDAKPQLDVHYAMPIFIGRLLPVGLIGIISAAMIAAFMSTHDSYLLCWSSVITQDVIAPLRGGELSTTSRVRLTRILIVVIGIFIWWWGLFYEGSDDIWDYMAITGAIYFTGAFALLAGGLYWKRGSSAGAIAGLIGGCSAICGLGPIRIPIGRAVLASLGREVTDEAVDKLLTSARVGLASIGVAIVLYIVFSLVIPDKTKERDPT